jgi:hypothetical protein
VARYDKYDGKVGGFRAPLAADWDADAVGVPTGVGLDANGRIVAGAGNTGIKGVLVIDYPMNAGDVVDTMTDGEIVDCTGLAAGTSYFADGAAGAVGTDNTDTYVGHTVEAQRLIVRAAR